VGLRETDVGAARAVQWAELRSARPDLAESGRALLYQFGVGLAFLGTVRLDGGPRLHPVCPIVAGDGMYVQVEPSPKRQDLLRDGRYALHSFPCATNEDAFYLVGTARLVTDEQVLTAVRDQVLVERGWTEIPPAAAHQQLFELAVERVMLTRTTGHGDFAPVHTLWRPGDVPTP
jgi:hypothetical protein